jgi:hypothetical protein
VDEDLASEEVDSADDGDDDEEFWLDSENQVSSLGPLLIY